MAAPSHPVVAAILDPVMAPMQKIRARTIPEVTGRVLEIGAGTGQNFAHYRDARSVTAIEPDPHMRHRATRKLEHATVPIELVDAGAEALPFEDRSFDTVVATWVLCTIPEVERAIAEMRRVLTPGGTLIFAEHVRSSYPLGRGLQRALNPAWRFFAGGCNLHRDSVQRLADAGLEIVQQIEVGPQRFTLAPMVVGRARKR